jgi:hypothetical protein
MIDIFCSSAWRVAVIHDGYYISGMNGAIYAGDSWTQNVQRQQSGGWHYYSYDNVLNDNHQVVGNNRKTQIFIIYCHSC